MTPEHRRWALREIDVSPGQSPGLPRPQSGLPALPLRGNEPRTVWRKRTTSTHQEQENRVSGTMLGDCTTMTCVGRFLKKLKQKSISDQEGKQNQLFIGCSLTSKYQEKSFVLQKEKMSMSLQCQLPDTGGELLEPVTTKRSRPGQPPPHSTESASIPSLLSRPL